MSAIEFVNLAPGDYDRAKTIFNKAKHPGFIGRELFYRCATTGETEILESAVRFSKIVLARAAVCAHN